MINRLGFKDKPYSYDNKEIDEYNLKLEHIKNEKNLNADEILKILLENLDKKLLTRTERNYKSSNDNPFDLAVGDIENLDLFGFEIKSDLDTFTRLKDQLQAYFFVFDDIYLVLHKKNRPEWLPEGIGVIRVFENKEIYVEKGCFSRDYLDISSNYEWDSLFRCNGLGITSSKTREVLEILKDVRKNIMFNRFFAVSEGFNTKKFSKFFPFTEKQKSVLIGFDVPYHYKNIVADINDCEKRLDKLKGIIAIGIKGSAQLKINEVNK